MDQYKPSKTPGLILAFNVTAEDLPLHCPTADMELWDSHPRVFLPIEKQGKAVCPYCGTVFILKNI